MVKLLFIFLLYFFSFLGLTIQKGVWESVMSQSHDRSHDKHGKVVHRPCSSCISSIENLMGILSSFSCQMLIKEQLA